MPKILRVTLTNGKIISVTNKKETREMLFAEIGGELPYIAEFKDVRGKLHTSDEVAGAED